MTVSNDYSFVEQDANGVTTAFPFSGLKIDDASDLVVSLTKDDGTVITYELGIDYTITGVGNNSGGVVIFATPPETGKLLMDRIVPITQTTNLRNQGRYMPEVVEKALDKMTMIAQQIARIMDRAMKIPASVVGVSTDLPLPVSNNILGWSPDATKLQNYDLTEIATQITYGSAYADTFLGDGATTSFVLSATPGSVNNLDLSIGGATQIPNVDFTWDGNKTITMTTPVPIGVPMLVRYSQALPIGNASAANIAYGGFSLATVLKTQMSRTVDSLSALRTVQKAYYTRAIVLGTNTAGDGGGGIYYLDAADTTTADNGGTIIVAADGGRWKRSGDGRIDVRLFGVQAGVTTSQSAKIAAAQAACMLAGAIPYLPAGTYYGSIGVSYSGGGIIGEGAAVTKMILPATTYAIASITSASNVVTVTTTAASGTFVGQRVAVKGVANSQFNHGYIVLSVINATQFTCQSLNQVLSDATSSGGTVSEATCCDLGELTNGNSATVYSYARVHGITFDGNRSNRVTPPDDLTDWGISMTKMSYSVLSDVRAINCWQGGVGIFINSNYNHVQAYVENCGFSAQTPAGFDVNSSNHNIMNVISKACNYGARVIDNCFGNIGNFTINGAVLTGFIHGNQTVNNSSSNRFNVEVLGGCSIAGAQIGQKVYGLMLDINIASVGGYGILELDGQSSNGPFSNTYRVSTRNCQGQSAIIGSGNGRWTINSNNDGLAGSQYAIDIRGNYNQIDAVVTSANVVNAVILRSGALGNDITKLTTSGTLSEITDSSGQVNFYEDKAWRVPTLAGSWVQSLGSPYAPVGYKKCGRSVRLSGNVGSGSGTMFTLPVGFRPLVGTQRFTTIGNNALAIVSVAASGAVTLDAGTATSVALDGINFAIDG